MTTVGKFFNKVFTSSDYIDGYARVAASTTAKPGRRLLQQAGLIRPSVDGAKATCELACLHILDNAAGTGIITDLLKTDPESLAKDASVLATDINKAMLQYLQRAATERDYHQVDVKVLDMHDLDLPPNTFSHVFINFAFMSIADPDKAMRGCHRVLAPGGIVGFTTWRDPAWIDFFMQAAKSIPDCPPVIDMRLMLTKSGRWDDTTYAIDFLERNGFEAAHSEAYTFDWDVPYVSEWVAGVGLMMGGYIHAGWSEEQKEQFGRPLREATRRLMRERLGGESDVRFPMTAIVATARKASDF